MPLKAKATVEAIRVDPAAAALKDVAQASAKLVPDLPEMADKLRPLNGAPSMTMLPLMIQPLTNAPQFMEMVRRSLANVMWRFSPMRYAPAPAVAVARAMTPPLLSGALSRAEQVKAQPKLGLRRNVRGEEMLRAFSKPNAATETLKLNSSRTVPLH